MPPKKKGKGKKNDDDFWYAFTLKDNFFTLNGITGKQLGSPSQRLRS